MPNAEFRRYLWLEFSVARAVIAPLLVGAIAWLAYLMKPEDFGSMAISISKALLFIVLLIWGTRLASDSVTSEVADGTWVFQRMSSMSAGEMTLGKLFGSTAMVWYSTFFICLLYLAGAFMDKDTALAGKTLVATLLAGLCAHSLGMLASLSTLRTEKVSGLRRRGTGFLIGIGVAMTLMGTVSTMQYQETGHSVHWFSLDTELVDFTIFSLAYAVFWSLVGLVRAMRRELQYDNTPAVWSVFVASLLLYVAGIIHGNPQTTLVGPVTLWACFTVLSGLAWATVLLDPFDSVAWKRTWQNLRRLDLREAWIGLPTWVPTLAATAAMALILVLTQAMREPLHFLERAADAEFTTFLATPLAVVFYLLRDIAVVATIRTSGSSKSHFFVAVYMVAAYGLLPVILLLLKVEPALYLLWPMVKGNVIAQLTPPLLEAVATWMLLLRSRAVRGILVR